MWYMYAEMARDLIAEREREAARERRLRLALGARRVGRTLVLAGLRTPAARAAERLAAGLIRLAGALDPQATAEGSRRRMGAAG